MSAPTPESIIRQHILSAFVVGSGFPPDQWPKPEFVDGATERLMDAFAEHGYEFRLTPPDLDPLTSDEQREVEQCYRDFWRPIVEVGGALDAGRVKRELYDYSVVIEEVPKVYTHVTGGRISKPHTHAAAVIAEADEHYTNVPIMVATTEEAAELILPLLPPSEYTGRAHAYQIAAALVDAGLLRMPEAA